MIFKEFLNTLLTFIFKTFWWVCIDLKSKVVFKYAHPYDGLVNRIALLFVIEFFLEDIRRRCKSVTIKCPIHLRVALCHKSSFILRTADIGSLEYFYLSRNFFNSKVSFSTSESNYFCIVDTQNSEFSELMPPI